MSSKDRRPSKGVSRNRKKYFKERKLQKVFFKKDMRPTKDTPKFIKNFKRSSVDIRHSQNILGAECVFKDLLETQ